MTIKLVEAAWRSFPNARIFNIYGTTETSGDNSALVLHPSQGVEAVQNASFLASFPLNPILPTARPQRPPSHRHSNFRHPSRHRQRLAQIPNPRLRRRRRRTLGGRHPNLQLHGHHYRQIRRTSSLSTKPLQLPRHLHLVPNRRPSSLRLTNTTSLYSRPTGGFGENSGAENPRQRD